MNKYFIVDIALIIVAFILLMAFMIICIYEERKNWDERKFFQYTLHSEDNYFLYIDMVKKMKRILFKKRMELICLSFLVFFRRLFIWNKKY